MTFSKGDLVTFGIGCAIAVSIEIGVVLSEFNANEVDYKRFGLTLFTGIVTASGRYLATRLPEVAARLRNGGDAQ